MADTRVQMFDDEAAGGGGQRPGARISPLSLRFVRPGCGGVRDPTVAAAAAAECRGLEARFAAATCTLMRPLRIALLALLALVHVALVVGYSALGEFRAVPLAPAAASARLR
jgi:hypothetical protein